MPDMSAVLSFLTILALIIGIRASSIIVIRKQKLAKFGVQHEGTITDEQQRAAVSANSFRLPLAVAIICGAIVAAWCVHWFIS